MLAPESPAFQMLEFSETHQPMLYLEVNIGGDRAPGKLLIFEGDKPEEVVRCFGKVYQISENKQAKLLDIVKLQMTKILQQIGEVVNSEEDGSSCSDEEESEIINPSIMDRQFRQFNQCDQSEHTNNSELLY